MKSKSVVFAKRNKWSGRKINASHGSATIFFCIVLSVVIPLTGILIDLVRYRYASQHVKKVIQTTADSLLSQYNRPMREEYGIFSIGLYEKEELIHMAYEIVNENLSPYLQKGINDLYQFQIQKVDVIPLKNLSETEVLEQQIIEFMKYRAPLQLSAGFFEKIQAFYQATEETEIISSDMTLDRELDDMRIDRVHLSMMLKEIIPQIGVEDKAQTANIRERIEKVFDENQTTIIENMNQYEKASNVMRNILPEARILFRNIEQAESTCEAAQSNLTAASVKVQIAETAAEKAESEEDKENADQVLANAIGLETACRNALEGAKNNVESRESTLKSFLYEKWNPVTQDVISALTAIQRVQPVYMDELLILKVHLQRYYQYVNKTIEIIDPLSEKLLHMSDTLIDCNTLAKNSRAGGATGKLASSLTDASQEDELLGNVKSPLEEMNNKITNWIYAVETLEHRFNSRFNEINTITVLLQPVIVNPTSQISGTVPAISSEFIEEEWGSKALIGLIELAKGYEMKKNGTLLIPDYPLKPAIQDVEKNEFYEWFSGWSGENLQKSDEEADSSSKESKKTLKALRSAANNTAELVQETNSSKNKELPVIDEVSAKNLPTGENGYSGSLEQLAEIGELMKEITYPMDYGSPIFDDNLILGKLDEHHENMFTSGIKQVSELGKQIRDCLSDSSENLMKSIYVNEYALSAFKNRLSEGQLENDIGWDRHLNETAFSAGEVEYILYGKTYESKNLNAMKYALFATRLAFDLLHVYTTPDKESSALALATTLAGWTVFGIPVVHNFLMISWAAAEACVDVDKLLKGEDVPIVKTSANWYLGVNGLKEELLQNLLLDPARREVSGWVGTQINTANQAIQEEVGSWIDSGVDTAFASIESQCSDYGEKISEELYEVTESMPDEFTSSVAIFVAELSGIDKNNTIIETFEQKLSLWIDTLRNICTETIKSESARQVLQWKMQCKAELKDAVFQSSFYKNLLTTVEKEAVIAIDEGFDSIENNAEKLLSKTLNQTGLKDGISGKMLTMNYQDYLSLFMLSMRQDVKIARIGDLMQMNVAQIANETTPMKERQTAIFIKAEVIMDFWFLPDALMKKTRYGTIKTEWGQSY